VTSCGQFGRGMGMGLQGKRLAKHVASLSRWQICWGDVGRLAGASRGRASGQLCKAGAGSESESESGSLRRGGGVWAWARPATWGEGQGARGKG
jgi:hypothetical protein